MAASVVACSIIVASGAMIKHYTRFAPHIGAHPGRRD